MRILNQNYIVVENANVKWKFNWHLLPFLTNLLNGEYNRAFWFIMNYQERAPAAYPHFAYLHSFAQNEAQQMSQK